MELGSYSGTNGQRTELNGGNIPNEPRNLITDIMKMAQSMQGDRRSSQRSIKTFMKLHPPTFNGERNPKKAESWLDDIVDLFNIVECPDDRRAPLAAYHLIEGAKYWWKATKSTTFAEVENISWKDFLTEFQKEYFLPHMRVKKQEQFLNLQGNVQPGSANRPNGPKAELNVNDITHEQRFSEFVNFLRFNPPTYDGDVDPEKAESWLDSIMDIFEILQCPDYIKVSLATYRLTGVAKWRWKDTETTKFSEVQNISWKDFLTEFQKQYFLVRMRREKEVQSLTLQQGNMTVTEYLTKFYQLERYCTLEKTERQRAERFIGGLGLGLRMNVRIGSPKTVTEAIELAINIEEDYYENKMKLLKGKTLKREFHHGEAHMWQQQKKQKIPKGLERRRMCSLCSYCGKLHPGECYRKMGLCFICGQKGHFIQDCPTKKENFENKTTTDSTI